MYRQNTSTIDQAESIHKDNLISSLRKQLNQLHNLEHDFIAVNDEITSAQSKQAILVDQIDNIENQHKVKADINRQNISQLRNQIDHLKIQTHKCNVHIEDLLRQNASLKRMCDNREGEIAVLIGGNQNLQNKNDEQIQQNKSKTMQIKKLKDERNKNQLECERMQRQLEDGVTELKALEKSARVLESSIARLSNILVLAEKDHSQLVEQMVTREEWMSVSNKKLNQLNNEIDDLRDKSNKLQKDCVRNDEQYRKCLNNLEDLMTNNKQLNKKLKNLQNNSRVIDNQCDKIILERQALTNDHMQLANENKILNNEIDRCLLQILEYQKINQQLQKQVKHYIECDEQARQMLNRKDIICDMLMQVSNKLHQTSENISHLR